YQSPGSWQPPSYPGPSYDQPMAMRHSGLGIASCVIGVLVAIAMVGLLAVASIMEESRPGGLPDDDPALVAIGVGILGLACLNLLALGLGIGGLFQAHRIRGLSI